MAVVLIKRESKLAIVSIDNPPVNALLRAVRQGLSDAIDCIDADENIRAVVLLCVGRTFIAGADVREFAKSPQPPHLPDVIAMLDKSAKPWVAAIHGTALGGGLEVALGCRYRIATPDAKLGLPEVNLGLIPGAGGTVRLPRLIGVEAALNMIASGKPVSAKTALSLGLVDRIADGDLTQAAMVFAKEISTGSNRAPLIEVAVQPPKDSAEWSARKSAIQNKARGQNAPLAALQAVENALTLSSEQALTKERALFVKLKNGPQSNALRHIFFAERAVAKIERLQSVAARESIDIGVIGGGTMGAGIAAACLLAGLRVTMLERDEKSLGAGIARVRTTLKQSHSRNLIDTVQLARMQAEFAGALDYSSMSGVDLVIEAVFEDIDAKKDVFGQLDAATRPDTVLATNTSYLDVGDIAEAVSDPSRVLGLHFFSPAYIMKLLEIIHPPKVSDDVLATGFALAKRLGKIAVPAGVCDGFIANRMMSAYRRECEYMLEDGALPQQIDAAMVKFGFPMGVFAMQDLAGLDIAWATRKRQSLHRSADTRYVDIADRLCKMGRLGRKTGSGWYDYSDEPKGRPDPIVDQLVLSEAERKGIVQQTFTQEQIIARILSIMQLEGQHILDEGIADGEQAIDVVMVNGYGFPRWRGGPMYMRNSTEKT